MAPSSLSSGHARAHGGVLVFKALQPHLKCFHIRPFMGDAQNRRVFFVLARNIYYLLLIQVSQLVS